MVIGVILGYFNLKSWLRMYFLKMLKFKNFYIKMKYNCIKNVLGIKLLFNNIEI